MNESFEDEESCKNENVFLKMKLMLEHGAHFTTLQRDLELPADIENQFLHYVINYEQQAIEKRIIKVFDKVCQPRHFKPVSEISDDDIENAWNELDTYLNKYHIDVDVCSPNITSRELYRFTTEELFTYDINDIDLPGGTTCFTYDDFYPDHLYDNTTRAIDDCISTILRKTNFTWLPFLRSKKLRLNKHYPLSEKEFIKLMNRFKDCFLEIQLQKMNPPVCVFEQNSCYVKGNYEVILTIPAEEIFISGTWMVEYEFDESIPAWEIINVQIEGINF